MEGVVACGFEQCVSMTVRFMSDGDGWGDDDSRPLGSKAGGQLVE